ncbi:Cytochrome P450 monooxygenase gsfF [Lasiodiplodia hormozganensis]|uniref:Cytochrome P450 monooxygenase gsfF n=1 Tax=Lasiodiplodia hormozganensis TaxID=869390 RepID=A0AA40CIU1_9PEZI|nr:Cytochrome P450 monooxygenase gsfF [Lasiodiplodia hormozganensis]
MVKRALDAGAHGICVPLLNTADDARKLVSSAKFPPQGKRGFSPELAIGKFASKRTGDYLLQANDALVTIAQIETKEALDNVDEIAAVPGIDVLFIGPFDLANDIGHPIIGGIMHDELKAAFDRIYKAATDNGKWAGIYCNNGTEGHEYAQKGFHMVSIGADLVDIPSHFDNALCMARGPIVRIAPNECSVCDPQAWKEIYAVNAGFTKTDFYLTQAPNLSPHADSFTQLDEKKHTFRRRMIQHIFTFKTVLDNEKYIDVVTELFMQRMAELADKGTVFDISEWVHWYTFDVIGELFFGRMFGFLRERKDIGGYIAAVDIILPHAIRVAVLPKLLWPLQILVLPFSAKLRRSLSVFKSLTAVSKKLVDERVESGKGRPDMLERLLEVSREKSPDFDITDVYTESYTAIFAGSDTTAVAIRSALYNLCKNPDAYAKLQREIDQYQAEGKLSSIITYAEASNMPYVTAVCKEAMRVFPSIALSFPRHVPKGGRNLCGYYIPAGYRVGVNPAAFHFVKSIFGEDADDFNPDRWFRSDAKEMERHMFQFGQGSRQCIGKNVRAHVTLFSHER